MMSFLRGLILVVLVVVWARAAQAEEEVRISLQVAWTVKLAGLDMAAFDAESGKRIAGFKGKTTLTMQRRAGRIDIRRKKKLLGRARRVLVEARDGIYAAKGLYLGRMEVTQHAKGLLAVNRLPLEVYLLGIVGSEMHANWPIDSLKAQAVAARTYAMQRRLMKRAANHPFDLSATVLSQVYKGAEQIRPSVIRAVKETRGEVLSYKHDLVEALFHSTCGGRTVSAKAAFGRGVSYLRPRTCKWCRRSSKHRWKLTFTLAELSKKLERAGLSKGKLSKVETNGRSVLLQGKGRRRTVSPTDLRKAIGYSILYSARFTAVTKGGKVHFSGKGFGHGVGMCQWGARGMALAKKNYRQILEHYYQGAKIKRIY